MTKLHSSLRVALGGLAVALLALTQMAVAQTALSSTTLSAAINSSQKIFAVGSVTGMVAPSSSQDGSYLYVDREAMQIESINSTALTVTVQRGAHGTAATSHASGELLYYGSPNLFYDVDQFGSCTSSNQVVLPAVNVLNGNVFDCRSAGEWMLIKNGSQLGQGSQVNSFCTGSLGSAETEYLNIAVCSGATTSTAAFVVSSPGILADLQVSAGTAVTGGSSKDVLTVMKNGSATSLTCTIAASGTTCSDASHSVLVAAGDKIAFQFVTATTDGGANIRASVAKYAAY